MDSEEEIIWLQQNLESVEMEMKALNIRLDNLVERLKKAFNNSGLDF